MRTRSDRRRLPAGPGTVLVISLGGLGDFVIRWHLWESLRARFPAARITYAGYPRHAALLLEARLCDGMIDFQRAMWADPRRLLEGYDCIVAVMSRGGYGRFQRVVTAVRDGRCRGASRPAGRLIHIDPFPPAGNSLHGGVYIEHQMRLLGLPAPGGCGLKVRPDTDGWARATLEQCGVSRRQVIALHPGSGGEAKRWPVGGYLRLRERLVGEGHGVVVLTGEADDAVRKLMTGHRTCGGEIPVLFHDLPLPRLAALLGRCQRYVGNDSGISHLAALTGTSTTVIFGPTDHRVWRPRGTAVKVVRGAVSCSPCSREVMYRCRERRCLTTVTVDEVYRTLMA